MNKTEVMALLKANQNEQGIPKWRRYSQSGELKSYGMRSQALHAAALKVARKIGPLEIGSDDSNCEPFDVVKHLTSDVVAKRLGL